MSPSMGNGCHIGAGVMCILSPILVAVVVVVIVADTDFTMLFHTGY